MKRKPILGLMCLIVLQMLMTSCTPSKENVNIIDDNTEKTSESHQRELIESAQIEINIGVSSGSMALYTAKQFYEQKMSYEKMNFNYEIFYSESAIEDSLFSSSLDIGVLPLDNLLLMEGILSKYKIVGVASTTYPQLITNDSSATLESLYKENINVFYEHELFLKKYLSSEGINPSKDLNVIVWDNEEKMVKAYKDGKIKYGMFSMSQYQRLIADDALSYPLVDMTTYTINKLGFNGGIPTGVLVIRNEILELYPELCQAFESELIGNNTWIHKNVDEAKVFSKQLNLIDDTFDFGKFLATGNYYYEPSETSKHRLKRYFKWIDNYLSTEFELESSIYQSEQRM